METQFSEIAMLIGDPVRAKVLWALLDGRAYTATELAVYTNTTAQNLSMHLAKLVQSEMLSVEKQGRHRYYNFARPEISFAIEALANLIPDKEIKKKTTAVKPIGYCRTCYDHLAGKVGVMVTAALTDKGLIFKEGDDFALTSAGEEWFKQRGIKTEELRTSKRSFAKACLDWSERRHHLAGALGAALLDQLLADDWVRRTKDSRAVVITRKGKEELYHHLQLDL